MQTSSFWKNKYEELKKSEKDNKTDSSAKVVQGTSEEKEQLDEQIIKLITENSSLQSQLALKTNLFVESSTLIKLIQDSLTNGIGDGSINVNNGNALVGNTIKSLKLINDYVSNNTTHVTLAEFNSTETRLEVEVKINRLEQWQQDLINTNEKIQELIEKQEKISLEEKLKNIQFQSLEDQVKEKVRKI